MKYYLTMFLMLWVVTSAFAVETRSKPVQCGDYDSLNQVIEKAGEKPLVGGIAEVKFEGGAVEHLPVYVFANTDTGTFTIIEIHAEEVCVINYGNSLDFNVQQYFEKKTES